MQPVATATVRKPNRIVSNIAAMAFESDLYTKAGEDLNYQFWDGTDSAGNPIGLDTVVQEPDAVHEIEVDGEPYLEIAIDDDGVSTEQYDTFVLIETLKE